MDFGIFDLHNRAVHVKKPNFSVLNFFLGFFLLQIWIFFFLQKKIQIYRRKKPNSNLVFFFWNKKPPNMQICFVFQKKNPNLKEKKNQEIVFCFVYCSNSLREKFFIVWNCIFPRFSRFKKWFKKHFSASRPQAEKRKWFRESLFEPRNLGKKAIEH